MRLIVAASGLLAAVTLSGLGGPSFSSAVFAPQSRHTDLAGRACEVDPASRGHGGEEQVKRCPGLGDARAVVTADRSEVALGFEWSSRERTDEVLRLRSLGRSLEWRGLQTGRGFEPYAAIARLFPAEGSVVSDLPVLAVIRLRRGEACLIGVVDLAVNPGGEEIAKRLADERARAVTCGLDSARVGGSPSLRAAALATGG